MLPWHVGVTKPCPRNLPLCSGFFWGEKWVSRSWGYYRHRARRLSGNSIFVQAEGFTGSISPSALKEPLNNSEALHVKDGVLATAEGRTAKPARMLRRVCAGNWRNPISSPPGSPPKCLQNTYAAQWSLWGLRFSTVPQSVVILPFTFATDPALLCVYVPLVTRSLKLPVFRCGAQTVLLK